MMKGWKSMGFPQAGTTIEIVSFKHDQTFHRRWVENQILYSDQSMVVGGNNQTVVEEKTKTFRTKEPAIFLFYIKYWFNIVIIYDDPTDYFYYCNICSPFKYHKESLRYIDYDIDIIVNKDLSFHIVDKEEYVLNSSRMNYPKEVQHNVEKHIKILKSWIREKRNPFNEEFVIDWYHKLMK